VIVGHLVLYYFIIQKVVKSIDTLLYMKFEELVCPMYMYTFYLKMETLKSLERRWLNYLYRI